jgi:TrmH family RNA methyltransferase
MPLTKAAIARLRSLQEKKQRETLGLFLVEGEKVVGELLAARFPFLEIYATAEWKPVTAAPPPTLVSADEMTRISHFPTAASVLAVGKLERHILEPGTLDHGLTLALDGIQDPGNVGTLLRVADWFGLDRVLLSPDSADLFSQKVINASMGSFARMTVFPTPLAAALKSARVAVLGCDLRGDDVHTMKPLRDAVIVIGSEGRGISPGVGECLSGRITIPKYGGAESLNAAIAAAIVCDNLKRNG